MFAMQIMNLTRVHLLFSLSLSALSLRRCMPNGKSLIGWLTNSSIQNNGNRQQVDLTPLSIIIRFMWFNSEKWSQPISSKQHSTLQLLLCFSLYVNRIYRFILFVYSWILVRHQKLYNSDRNPKGIESFMREPHLPHQWQL